MSDACASWSAQICRFDMHKVYTIYRAKSTCGMVYIGVTGCDIKTRIRLHISASNGKNRMLFCKKIREVGGDAFLFQELMQTTSRKNAYQLEQELIKQAKLEFGDKCLNSPKDHRSSKNPSYRKDVIRFSHQVHGVVEVTRNELTQRFGLLQSKVSLLCSGKRKSHRGWRIINTNIDIPF